ncbi:BEACH domain-containing protein [Carpediemonas membranifera]|uniref:BEACH domain-containing protein n=1 Tax=Carpediemonas membranifera TaxID=201153 RepID=A0A8J6BA99_9EUKA|nr:BEACH domain-containing protein [Carpediemonas membranifera]|eukprot:KAG9396539.1 BEACH domain-containing protein [Carpediemonas membranifera]
MTTDEASSLASLFIDVGKYLEGPNSDQKSALVIKLLKRVRQDYITQSMTNAEHASIIERSLCLCDEPGIATEFIVTLYDYVSHHPTAPLLSHPLASHVVQTVLELIPCATNTRNDIIRQQLNGLILSIYRAMLADVLALTGRRQIDFVCDTLLVLCGLPPSAERHEDRRLVHSFPCNMTEAHEAARTVLGPVDGDGVIAQLTTEANRRTVQGLARTEFSRVIATVIRCCAMLPATDDVDWRHQGFEVLLSSIEGLQEGEKASWGPALILPDRRWIHGLLASGLRHIKAPELVPMLWSRIGDDDVIVFLDDISCTVMLVEFVSQLTDSLLKGVLGAFTTLAARCWTLLAEGSVGEVHYTTYPMLIDAVLAVKPVLATEYLEHCLHTKLRHTFEAHAPFRRSVLRATSQTISVEYTPGQEDTAHRRAKAMLSSLLELLVADPLPDIPTDVVGPLTSRTELLTAVVQLLTAEPMLGSVVWSPRHRFVMSSWAGSFLHRVVLAPDRSEVVSREFVVELIEFIAAVAHTNGADDRPFDPEHESDVGQLIRHMEPDLARQVTADPALLEPLVARIFRLALQRRRDAATGQQYVVIGTVAAVEVATNLVVSSGDQPKYRAAFRKLMTFIAQCTDDAAFSPDPRNSNVVLADADVPVRLLTTSALMDPTNPLYHESWAALTPILRHHTLPRHIRALWGSISTSDVLARRLADVCHVPRRPTTWIRLSVTASIVLKRPLTVGKITVRETFPGSDGYALVMWMRVPQTSTPVRMVSVGHAPLIKLTCLPDGLEFVSKNQTVTVSTHAVAKRAWWHVAVTHIPGDGKERARTVFYVNGIRLQSVYMPYPSTADFPVLAIGGSTAPNSHAELLVGPVVAFDCALTPADVFALYVHDAAWSGVPLPLPPVVCGEVISQPGVARDIDGQLRDIARVEGCSQLTTVTPPPDRIQGELFCVGGGDLIPPMLLATAGTSATNLLLTHAQSVLAGVGKERSIAHHMVSCRATLAVLSRRVACSFSPTSTEGASSAAIIGYEVVDLPERQFPHPFPRRKCHLLPADYSVVDVSFAKGKQLKPGALIKRLARNKGLADSVTATVCTTIDVSTALALSDAIPAMLVQLAEFRFPQEPERHAKAVITLLVEACVNNTACFDQFNRYCGVAVLLDCLSTHPFLYTLDLIPTLAKLAGLTAVVSPLPSDAAVHISLPLEKQAGPKTTRSAPLTSHPHGNCKTARFGVAVSGSIVYPDALGLLVDPRLFKIADVAVQRVALAIVFDAIHRSTFNLFQSRPHTRIVSPTAVISTATTNPKRKPRPKPSPPSGPTGVPVPHHHAPIYRSRVLRLNGIGQGDREADTLGLRDSFSKIPRFSDVAYGTPKVSGLVAEGCSVESVVMFDLMHSMRLLTDILTENDFTVTHLIADILDLLMDQPLHVGDTDLLLTALLASFGSSHRLALLETIFRYLQRCSVDQIDALVADGQSNVFTIPVLLGALSVHDRSNRAGLLKVLTLILDRSERCTKVFTDIGGHWIMGSLDIDVAPSDIAHVVQLLLDRSGRVQLAGNGISLQLSSFEHDTRHPEAFVTTLRLLLSLDMADPESVDLVDITIRSLHGLIHNSRLARDLNGEDSIDLLCSLVAAIAKEASVDFFQSGPPDRHGAAVSAVLDVLTQFVLHGDHATVSHILAHLSRCCAATDSATQAAMQSALQLKLLQSCLTFYHSLLAPADHRAAADSHLSSRVRRLMQTGVSQLALWGNQRALDGPFLGTGRVTIMDTLASSDMKAFVRLFVAMFAAMSGGDTKTLTPVHMVALRLLTLVVRFAPAQIQEVMTCLVHCGSTPTVHAGPEEVCAVLDAVYDLTEQERAEITPELAAALGRVVNGDYLNQILRRIVPATCILPDATADIITEMRTFRALVAASSDSSIERWAAETAAEDSRQSLIFQEWSDQKARLAAVVTSQCDMCREQVKDIIELLGRPLADINREHCGDITRALREQMYRVKRLLSRPNQICSPTLGMKVGTRADAGKISVDPLRPGLRWDDLDSDSDDDAPCVAARWGLSQREGHHRQRMTLKLHDGPSQQESGPAVRGGLTDVQRVLATPTTKAPMEAVVDENACLVVSPLAIKAAVLVLKGSSTLDVVIAANDADEKVSRLPPLLQDVLRHQYEWFKMNGDADAPVLGTALETKTKTVPLKDIRAIHNRCFLQSDSAVEIFHGGSKGSHTLLLVFDTPKTRDATVQRLVSAAPNLSFEPSRLDTFLKEMTQRWAEGGVSNFRYLMAVNTMAGRTFNDLSQYPVFPFVLKDYTAETIDLSDPGVYRDLSKPMGAQDECRLQFFVDRYGQTKTMQQEGSGTAPYHYGTHYSNASTALHYLVRLEPYATRHRALQSGNWDDPDRLFHSIPRLWDGSARLSRNEVRELIPEFFYLPDFLENLSGLDFGVREDGATVNDVELPPWASTPVEFVKIHRQALESPYVTKHLHQWIDLIFGFKQTGKAAVAACNVFHPNTYPRNNDIASIEDPTERAAKMVSVLHFGQCPNRVFKARHPPCRVTPMTPATVQSHPDCLVSRVREECGEPVESFAPPDVSKDIERLGPHRCALPHNSVLITNRSDGRLMVLVGGKDHSVWAFGAPVTNVSACQASLTGDSIVCGTASGLIFIGTCTIDTKGPVPVDLVIDTTSTVHKGAVTAASIDEEWDMAVTGDTSGLCVVWRLSTRTPRLRRTPHTADGGEVTATAISAGTGDIAVASRHRIIVDTHAVCLWTINGMFVRSVPVKHAVRSMLFVEGHVGREPRVLVLGLNNGQVMLLDGDNLAPLAKYHEHCAPVTALRATTTGSRLFSGDTKGKVVEWSIKLKK